MKRITLRQMQMELLQGLIEIDRICQIENIAYWIDSGTLLGAVRHKGFIPWDDDIDVCMLRDDFDKFVKIVEKYLNKKYFYLQTIKTDRSYRIFYIPCRLVLKNTLMVAVSRNVNVHYNFYIDIFPCDKYASNFFLRKIQQSISILFLIKTFAYQKNVTLYKFIVAKLVNFLFPIRLLEFFRYRISSFLNTNKNYNLISKGVELPIHRCCVALDKIFPLTKLIFEDKCFFAPKNYAEYLALMYGDDYMVLPEEEKQFNHGASYFVDEKNNT